MNEKESSETNPTSPADDLFSCFDAVIEDAVAFLEDRFKAYGRKPLHFF